MARAVGTALEALGGVWRAVAAMEAAEMSVRDPAWPLLAKLDFAGAAAVLEALQVCLAQQCLMLCFTVAPHVC